MQGSWELKSHPRFEKQQISVGFKILVNNLLQQVFTQWLPHVRNKEYKDE